MVDADHLKRSESSSTAAPDGQLCVQDPAPTEPDKPISPSAVTEHISQMFVAGAAGPVASELPPLASEVTTPFLFVGRFVLCLVDETLF